VIHTLLETVGQYEIERRIHSWVVDVERIL